MPKKKTHEEYVAEVAAINPNIEVIEEYINSRTKILHLCKIDGHEWSVKPNDILNGHGCPVCFGNAKKTHEQYIKDVARINPNIEVIGTYINNSIKILHRCCVDGFEWYAKPNNIISGYGCPQCKRNMITGRKRKTHEEYVEEVSYINPDIEVLERYVMSLTPILHRCKIDGHEWYATPATILSGHGCPQCQCSHGEKYIKKWCDNKNISYEHQKRFDDCRDVLPLPFDFYLPDYNVAIEYNGAQHYEEVEYFGGKERFEVQQRHDKIKENYCKENGIPLIRIPYYANTDEELEKCMNYLLLRRWQHESI